MDATSQTQSLSHLPEVGHLISDKAGSPTGQHDPGPAALPPHHSAVFLWQTCLDHRPWARVPSSLHYGLGSQTGHGAQAAPSSPEGVYLPLPLLLTPLLSDPEGSMESILLMSCLMNKKTAAQKGPAACLGPQSKLEAELWNSGLMGGSHTVPSFKDDTLSQKCRRDQAQPEPALSVQLFKYCKNP